MEKLSIILIEFVFNVVYMIFNSVSYHYLKMSLYLIIRIESLRNGLQQRKDLRIFWDKEVLLKDHKKGEEI